MAADTSNANGGAYIPGMPLGKPASVDLTNATNVPTSFVGGTTGTGAIVLASTAALTTPTLTTPVLSGSATGTYTLAGTPTISAPTINSPVISSLKSAFSTSTVSAGFAADTYLAGTQIALPTGGYVAGARYGAVFDMVKTAAGTAALVVTLRIGAAGTTSDAAILTFTFGAGTAAADTGTFEVYAHFRTVGSGTAAVMAGVCYCSHALAATGLISTGASGQGQLAVVSSGFDSTTANGFIGLSVNGGASFSGTNTVTEAELRSF